MNMSIDDVKDSDPIYVKSSAGIGKDAGDVNLILTNDTGKNFIVIVPKTFIPIKVTDFAPTIMFKNSPDFRRIIASGLITLIPIKEALAELNKPVSKTELERLRKEIFGNIDFQTQSNTPSTLEVISNLTDDNVTPRIYDIMMNSEPSMDESKRLSQLLAEESIMTTEDIDYIISTVEEKSEISKWAKKLKISKDSI